MARAGFIISEEYQTIRPGEPRGPLTPSGTVFHKPGLLFRDVGLSNGGRAWGVWETRMGERWVCLIGQPFRAHKAHHISYWRKTKHLNPDITITSSQLVRSKRAFFPSARLLRVCRKPNRSPTPRISHTASAHLWLTHANHIPSSHARNQVRFLLFLLNDWQLNREAS